MSAGARKNVSGNSPVAGAGRRRVLVTGAGSSVGRALIRALLDDPKVYFILALGEDDGPPSLASRPAKKFEYRRVDLLKERELRSFFRGGLPARRGIDSVVHLAFLHRPELTGRRTHALNVEGTKHLLDCCLEEPQIRKFIFRSSGMVYKLLPHGPAEIFEDDDLNFDPDVHPIIKDEVDAELLCRAKMDNGRVKIVVLRPSAVVGPGVHSYFNAYLESRVAVRVAGFNPLVNVVHVEDLGRALQLAVHANTHGVFNVTGLETLTLSELARRRGVRELAVPEGMLESANRALRRLGLTRFHASVDAARLKYSGLLSPTKAREALGYEPRHAFLARPAVSGARPGNGV